MVPRFTLYQLMFLLTFIAAWFGAYRFLVDYRHRILSSSIAVYLSIFTALGMSLGVQKNQKTIGAVLGLLGGFLTALWVFRQPS